MLKWNGTGFLDGVPARDLADEELEQYGGREQLLASGLYEEALGQKVKPQRKQDRFTATVDEKDDGEGE